MNHLPTDIQIVRRPEGGFAASAYSVGAFSEGETPDEAYENLLDAIRGIRLANTPRAVAAGSSADTVKPSQLTDEEWAEVEGRSDPKYLYGDDVRKLLYGEYVPASRWRRRA